VRRTHLLRPNASEEQPWECVWFDTETTQEQRGFDAVGHILSFGWAAYRRRLEGSTWSSPTWHRFTTASSLWTWLEGLLHGKACLYQFCHNAGFDLPVVDAFHELPGRGWKLLKAVIDCPPVILQWRRGKQTIRQLDTLNIWRQSLDTIGKQLGLPKLPMPGREADTAEWDIYCRRDVEVIMAACLEWFGFLQRHHFGSFAPTLAGQAMRAYRHRFMVHPILVDSNEPALELARRSYLGGRVECGRLGRVDGPVYRLDVNSMYPAVMRDNWYPTRLIGHTSRAEVAELHEWLAKWCVVAEVDLATDEPAYPVVVEGRLVFPVGRFLTVLASPELQHALERERVLAVHAVACYDRAVLFKAFVEECWAIRLAAIQAGDSVTQWLVKKLGQSVHGKFGQRGRQYREAGDWPDHEARAWVEVDVDTGRIYKHRTLGGLHQIWHDESESRDSCPAVAAHVTSYARLYLWGLICRAGRSELLYTDTDSLHTTDRGYADLKELIDPNLLGALKLEGVEPWMIYHGLKDYEAPGYRRTKGVRKSAHWVTPTDVVQEQWSSLVGLLRGGEVTAPTTRLIVKHLDRAYTKGTVEPSGLVLPLTLGP